MTTLDRRISALQRGGLIGPIQPGHGAWWDAALPDAKPRPKPGMFLTGDQGIKFGSPITDQQIDRELAAREGRRPSKKPRHYSLKDWIQREANRLGVPASVMLKIGGAESGYHPDVISGRRRSDTGATGVFQIMPQTRDYLIKKYGAQYGIKPGHSMGDPRVNTTLAMHFTKENVDAFRQKFGRDPQPHEIYLMHFQGFGGASQILSADPNTPLNQIITNPKVWASPTNRAAMSVNGRVMTAGELVNKYRRQFSGTAQAARSGVPGHVTQNPYDPSAARNILAAAGYSDPDYSGSQQATGGLIRPAMSGKTIGGQTKVQPNTQNQNPQHAALAMALSGQSKVPSYVQAMMQDAMKGPVNHPVDAIGRIAQFAAGAYVKDKHRERDAASTAALVQALTGGKLTPEAAMLSKNPQLQMWGRLKYAEQQRAAQQQTAQQQRLAAEQRGDVRWKERNRITSQQALERAKAGKTDVSVKVGGQRETIYDKEDARFYRGVIEGGSNARATLQSIGQMRRIAQGLSTGAGTNAMVAIRKIGQRLGVTVGKDVAAAEAFRNVSMRFVQQQVQQTKGAVSDKEMELFQQAVPTLSTTPEGRKIMLNVMEQIAKRKVEKQQFLAKWMRTNRGVPLRGNEKVPSFYEAWDQRVAAKPIITESMFKGVPTTAPNRSSEDPNKPPAGFQIVR